MLPIAVGFGIQEAGIVVLVILVLFGAKRIPEVGRSLGEGIQEFKKANRKAREEDEKEGKG